MVGDDPRQWIRRVSYTGLWLDEVWPGIDVKLDARPAGSERTFIVAPGRSATTIRVAFDGVEHLRRLPDGSLEAVSCGDVLRYTRPIAWQEIGRQRVDVSVEYRVHGNEYRFEVGPHDATRPLLIDPVLQATYVTGLRERSQVTALVPDGKGNAYVLYGILGANPAFDRIDHRIGIGGTRIAKFSGDLKRLIAQLDFGMLAPESASFVPERLLVANDSLYLLATTTAVGLPVPGGFQPEPGKLPIGGFDAYVARFSSGLDALLSATYLGGTGSDYGADMAAGPDGSIYVAGLGRSRPFPGAAGVATAFELNTHGIFVSRISANLGTLLGTRFAAGEPGAERLVVGPSGDVYVGAPTRAMSDPAASSGAQPVSASPPRLDGSPGTQTTDVFVTRFDSTLTETARGTFVGGSGSDDFADIAIGADGYVYIAGNTRSANLPATAGAAQSACCNGLGQSFVTRLTPILDRFERTTYLGSERGFGLNRIIAEPEGSVLVAGGYAHSDDFPDDTSPEDHYYVRQSLVRLSGNLTVFQDVGQLYFPRPQEMAVDGPNLWIWGSMGRDRNLPRTSGTLGPVSLADSDDEDSYIAVVTRDLAGFDRTYGPVDAVLPSTYLRFGAIVLGEDSPTAHVEVHNVGDAPIRFHQYSSSTVHEGWQTVRFDGSTCRPGDLVEPGSHCTIAVMLPSLVNSVLPSIFVEPMPGFQTTLFVQRGFEPHAIEYYHPGLDHYFMTSDPAEQKVLDRGQLAGWRRTGGAFPVRTMGGIVQSRVPVCRFYIPPPYGGSHFYSAFVDECRIVAERYPQFILESSQALEVYLPHPEFMCTPATASVYRLWNARQDTNHRFTNDPAVRDFMVGKGWVREGMGPDQVAMCAP